MGMMTFGDIYLSPLGLIKGDAMSANRIKNLIRELKHVCTGIPLIDAKLEMQPSHKVKPNQEALEANLALLQEGLEVHASQSIDKKENASMRKKCSYCGLSDRDDNSVSLYRCACRAAYYCGKEHQRAHWKDHKRQCRNLREQNK
jgi:hypothetical protein